MFENRRHWADKAFWWVAPIVIVASAVGGAYYYFHSRQHKVEPQARNVMPPPPPAEPAIQHPIPATSNDVQPLPPLNESDPLLRDALANLFGDVSVKKMLIPEDIVRRIVVTVDNLPRQKLAVEKRPIKALTGQTKTNVAADVVTLSDDNYARYAPYIALLRSMDTQALADLYVRFYPLFQQSYEDLGYPDQYFNDRLVDTIDNLLATPEVSAPVALVQPKVFYEFADAKLEALPAGQKVLIRMGRENAAVVKAKLRELRKAVTGGGRLPSMNSEAGAPKTGIVSPPGGLHHWL